MDVFYDPKNKTILRDGRLIKNFYGIGYETFNALKKFKDNIAQIDAVTNELVYYDKYLQKCIRCALKMRDLGIKKADIISISSQNNLNVSVVLIATQFLGAILAPIDRLLSDENNEFILKQVTPKIIFVYKDIEENITKIIEKLQLDTLVVSFDPSNKVMEFSNFLENCNDEATFEPYKTKNTNEIAFIMYSSGTTSRPKGACLNHNYLILAKSLLDFDDIKTGMFYCDIFWTICIRNIISFIWNGITNVVVDFLDRDRIWFYVEKYKINYLFLLTVMIDRLSIESPVEDISSLKYINFSGETVNEESFQKVSKYLPHVSLSNCYGSTETGLIAFFQRNEIIKSKSHSCGYPFFGTTIKIVDPDTEKSLGFNEHGEIRIKKTNLTTFRYYKYNGPDFVDSEGYFKIKDWGYYDMDCCVHIVERQTNIFRCLLWRIVPSEIEKVFKSHLDVLQAVVIGIPDDEYDNLTTGVVVLKDNATTTSDDLITFVNDRVEQHNCLRGGVKIVKHLPITGTEKIKRKEILKMVLENRL